MKGITASTRPALEEALDQIEELFRLDAQETGTPRVVADEVVDGHQGRKVFPVQRERSFREAARQTAVREQAAFAWVVPLDALVKGK